MNLTEGIKKAHEIDVRMRRNFTGFTFEMFNFVLQFQHGMCAICGRKGHYLRLSLDHDHKSGKIRGVLCWRCNRALTAFDDDPIRFGNAARYLTTPPVTEAFGKELYTLPGRVDTKKRRKMVEAFRQGKITIEGYHGEVSPAPAHADEQQPVRGE